MPLFIIEILDFQESSTNWSVKNILGNDRPNFQHVTWNFGWEVKYDINSPLGLFSGKSNEKNF